MLYVEEIAYQDPVNICQIFADRPGTVFLDSARINKSYGRYSYIAVDPFAIITDNSFNQLRKVLNQHQFDFNSDLPPFQGGMAGYLGYDLRHSLEKLPRTERDDVKFADMFMGAYDLVISFDNIAQRAWICSSNPTNEKQRCSWLKDLIKYHIVQKLNLHSKLNCSIKSNFNEEKYINAVEQAKNYILNGDIFEANIAQRFATNMPDCTTFELYLRLRKHNPAPFAAYINIDNNSFIASASPERFLKLAQSKVEARPIKGTRARSADPVLDQQAAADLLASAKDQAENIMIVDLMRNDLSKVCLDHSVTVPQLCGLESYATVHHLVSVINGQLKPEYNAIDLLCAAFPGGSVTGAPKIRAMEIIGEIEQVTRGPYCGSIGYIGFNGSMDTSIVIRTFVIKDDIVSFHAGGAVVLDSNPQDEYKESLSKADALRKVLQDLL